MNMRRSQSAAKIAASLTSGTSLDPCALTMSAAVVGDAGNDGRGAADQVFSDGFRVLHRNGRRHDRFLGNGPDVLEGNFVVDVSRTKTVAPNCPKGPSP